MPSWLLLPSMVVYIYSVVRCLCWIKGPIVPLLCQIMPYAMVNRFCQNLCWHNLPIPIPDPSRQVMNIPSQSVSPSISICPSVNSAVSQSIYFPSIFICSSQSVVFFSHSLLVSFFSLSAVSQSSCPPSVRQTVSQFNDSISHHQSSSVIYKFGVLGKFGINQGQF